MSGGAAVVATAAAATFACLPRRLPGPWSSSCRYEKYDSSAVVREKTDDPFQDELNMVADKVQDLQLVRFASCTLGPAPAGECSAAPPCTAAACNPLPSIEWSVADSRHAGTLTTASSTPPPFLQRSDEILQEKNRALKAALNAELRKTKATLLEQAIPLLEKMAKKGKGLTPEKIQSRQAQVHLWYWVGVGNDWRASDAVTQSPSRRQLLRVGWS